MSLVNDSEKLRWICRNTYITFNIAIGHPAGTTSHFWVVRYLNRFEDSVKCNWNHYPVDCEMDSQSAQVAESLSQESKKIINESLARVQKTYPRTSKRDRSDSKEQKMSCKHLQVYFTPLVPRLFIRFQRQNCHRITWRITSGFVSY